MTLENTVHTHTHTAAVFKIDCRFRFRLSLDLDLFSVCFFAILFLCCLLFLLDLVSSVLSQEIGWEERLRNDLFYVEWDVKP